MSKSNPIDPRIPVFDSVTKPKHYVAGRDHEPLDVIKDWKLDYHLGCALKYISRAGRKGAFVEDVQKAIFYLQDRLKHEQEMKRTETSHLEDRWPEMRYTENEVKKKVQNPHPEFEGICPECKIFHIEKPCPKTSLRDIRGGQ